MTEEITSIRNAVDDLRYSAKDIERALDSVSEDGNRLMAKVAWLTRENAKLKELVRDMKHHICRMHADDPCDAVCDAYDSGLRTCSYALRMRKLDVPHLLREIEKLERFGIQAHSPVAVEDSASVVPHRGGIGILPQLEYIELLPPLGIALGEFNAKTCKIHVITVCQSTRQTQKCQGSRKISPVP